VEDPHMGITEGLQKIIDAGYPLWAIPFHGRYINVTSSRDIGKAEEILNEKDNLD
jgi:hypothetical protein